MQVARIWSLGWEDPLEKEMATHCSILAWRIPWIEEAGGLQSTGSQRVRHDWKTEHTHTLESFIEYYVCTCKEGSYHEKKHKEHGKQNSYQLEIFFLPTECYWRYRKTGTLVRCWWECNLVKPLWKQYEVSSKDVNRTTLQSRNSTPGYLSDGSKTLAQKDICIPVFNMGSPRGSEGKESACNAGELGLIPGSGKYLGEGNGYPLQYSCLENPMDRGAWKATVY